MKSVSFFAGARQWAYLAIVLAPLPINANQAPPVDSSHVHQLAVLVDGSKTPELIPDDLAYNHFILGVAQHLKPTPDEVRLRESRLAPIDLSKQDLGSLVSALTGLREDLDSFENAEAAAGGSGDLTVVRARWHSSMSAARDRLQFALTPDGLARLDSFIRDHVKRFIVIYGSN
jgi:hypothetical protein